MADLDPDAAAFLERFAAAGAPPLWTLTPEQARASHVAASPALTGPGEPVEEVYDDVLGGVPVRVYRPAGARGATVYVHGGGWVVGTLDTYDPLCRELANRSGSTVVSVDYTLAPEARHPTQVGQVVAVLREAAVLAAGAGLAVAGDSAGGHLAALAAAQAPALAALVLVYPVVRPELDTASARDNATGRYLETEGMRWYWSHYLPAGPTDVPVDLRQAPLGGLPPVLLLTAGFDPLRDEGLELGDALEAAGVPVERLSYDGQVHGFWRFGAVMPAAHEALERIGGFLRRHL
jgi:acetyl esterase